MNASYGLVFDVDGVIADTESVNRRVSVQVFDDLFGVKGVKDEDFTEGLGRGAHEYVKAAARVHNLDLTPEQLEKAVQYRQDLFLEVLRTEPLPAYPGVLELIEAGLADERFQVAIATSGTLEKSRAALEAAQVPYTKMVYVNGNDVTHKKPDPELFLIAAQRMGLDPARCVVIEDAPNGVQAAKAAGTKCIGVTNTTPAKGLSQADLICDSLEPITLQTLEMLVDGRWPKAFRHMKKTRGEASR
ncbi:MAG: HAD family phosphatase [Phycisphaerales bacterium]|nr:MAG: HAD family phosphatase [Phycisphaerales bacterium]